MRRCRFTRCERCVNGYRPLKGDFGCVHGNAGEPGDKCECPAGEPLCRAIPPRPEITCINRPGRRRLSASESLGEADSERVAPQSLRSAAVDAEAIEEMRAVLRLPQPAGHVPDVAVAADSEQATVPVARRRLDLPELGPNEYYFACCESEPQNPCCFFCCSVNDRLRRALSYLIANGEVPESESRRRLECR